MITAEILTKKYPTLLKKYSINTPLRLQHFWTQLEHESNLKLVRENMNYSTKRLIEVFKSRFDRNKDGWLSPEEKKKVLEISGNPQKIANFLYSNRVGNGNESTGDGWKYRAGGYIGITFRGNYRELSKDTGIDFESNPDLLLDEASALLASLWFWNKNNLNKYADQDNIDAISDLINIGKITKTIGDANGYKHRVELLKKYKKIFKK